MQKSRNVVAECNETTADIVFALDASGSISGEDFEQVKRLVGAVVHSLTIRTDLTPNGFQVALISFADDTDVRFYLDTYTDKELMLAAINVPYTRGGTNLDHALRYTTQSISIPSLSFPSSFFHPIPFLPTLSFPLLPIPLLFLSFLPPSLFSFSSSSPFLSFFPFSAKC